jgi:hypothetical protein
MGIYFSAHNCAFYNDAVIEVSALPSDAVAVSDAAFSELMAAQAAGKVIAAGSDGNPVAVEQSCGTCHCTLHELVKASETQSGHVTTGDIQDVVSPMLPTAATSSKLGIVRPDNITIVVNGGVLSATVDISGKAEDDAVVHISGDETVSGVKSFLAIPQIPTADAGDSSNNGASTEFVGNAISSLANPIDYVVEEKHFKGSSGYGSNSTWYRKWKSGWLEQGGTVLLGSTDTNKTTLTFPVPFGSSTGLIASAYKLVITPYVSQDKSYLDHTLGIDPTVRYNNYAYVKWHGTSGCMTGFEWLAFGRQNFPTTSAGTYNVNFSNGEMVKEE